MLKEGILKSNKILSIENVKIAAASDSESVALKSYGIYNKEAGVITLRKRW